MSEFEIQNGIGIIPPGTTIIDENAFAHCTNLESVVIPSTVNYIAEGAFRGCFALKSIVVEKENVIYDSRENCNAIIESSTGKLIAGCYTTVLPYGVKEIAERAFVRCSNLTYVKIPQTIEVIGKLAFGRCTNLFLVEFEGRTRLDGRPFAGCPKLKHTRVDYFKEIRSSQMFLPINGILVESPVYIAYDGSLYWVLDKNYYPKICCIYSEMKYLCEHLMAVKVNEYWQLCVPEKYGYGIEYYHDHQFTTCELIASYGNSLILRDGEKLYVWSTLKRDLSRDYDSIEKVSKGWNSYYIVSRDNLYGVISGDLDVVVECRYHDIHYMGGYLIFSLNSLYGIMSPQGDILQKAVYSSIELLLEQYGPFEGVLKTCMDGRYGLYRYHGYICPQFDNIYITKAGVIVEDQGKKGLFNSDGTCVLNTEFDKIYDFSYWTRELIDEYLVKKDGKYGIIDRNHNIILQFEYDTVIRVFSDDYKYEYLEEYGTEDGDVLYKDRSFMAHEVVYQMVRDEETVFSWALDGCGYWDMRNPSFYIFICQYSGKWGVLDKNGNTIIPFEFYEIVVNKLYNRKMKESYRTEKYLRCYVKRTKGDETSETIEIVLF